MHLLKCLTFGFTSFYGVLFYVAIKDLYIKFQEVIGEFFGRIRKSRVAPILDDKNETFDNSSDFQFLGKDCHDDVAAQMYGGFQKLDISQI